MRPALLCLPLALTACANTIHGEVNGERAGGARDAIFQVYSLDLGPLGTITGIALAITGASSACETLDALQSLSSDCNDQCDELGQISHDSLPPADLWTLVIGAGTDDEVLGTYPHTDQADFDGFGATIEHDDVSAWRDYDDCMALCEAGEEVPSDSESSTGGELTITDYTSGEELVGEYRIEFGGDELTGHFSASWCEIFEGL
ncbi:MAG: hypothetical protein ABIO70_06065 [Pseudomonadota bacterium]